eukprot:TRINITY_DN207_c0_g1_i2.p1 TRINITY_DN207_c0_g1~~TRINITY_DN207_c0_g1_i2.p1  ORF type:complete len:362 (+),score=49.32 TRINITY_DN207_c0_g1_i2:115-1200(+)
MRNNARYTEIVLICQCEDQSLCDPIATGFRDEYFMFSTSAANWMGYNWSIATTVAVAGPFDPLMICTAHAAGARVVLLVDFPVAQLFNGSARAIAVASWLMQVTSNFFDGINIDVESPIPAGSPEVDLLTRLVYEARTAFHTINASYQVTFDVAWSADCIDGRCYDYAALSEVSDFLFVMAYDIRSQIFGPCIAGANSGEPKVFDGLESFLRLKIPAAKLVLGLPWYGYDYQCVNPDNTTICPIQHVPFRGVNCSDAAGQQINYSQLMDWLAENTTLAPQWSAEEQTPWFSYKTPSAAAGSVQHQVWYDDAQSIRIKTEQARKFGVRGVGVWQADALDYGDEQRARMQTAEMWQALHAFSW